MKKRNASLRSKIFSYNILIFVCAVSIFYVIVAKQFTDAIMKNEKQNTAREIELINNNLDTMITDTEDYLRIAASDKELQKIVSEYLQLENKDLEKQKISYRLSQSVSNIMAPNTKISGAAVLADGEVLYAGYSISADTVKEVLDETFLDQVEEMQRATWGDLKLLTYTDKREEYVFPVCKIIMDKETGERLGILALFLGEKNFKNIYQKSNEDLKKRYIIINENETIISSFDEQYLNRNIRDVLPISLEEYEELREKGQVFAAEKKTLYTERTYPRFNWSILGGTDLNGMMREKKELLFTNLLFLSAIVFLVFLCSYLISHTITKPLYGLLQVMDRIGRGEMNQRANIDNGEIGILAEGFNQLMDKLQNAIHQIYEEQTKKRKSELQLLQSQIQPHFLYNTLETVASFIKLDYKDKALATIQNISGFYRISLSSGKEIIELQDEIKILESYLQIQCSRYADKLQYEIDVNDNIKHCQIPKLILQPLVENSIYHGIKQSDEAGIVVIHGYEKDDMICLEVFDTGVGMSSEKIRQVMEKMEGRGESSFGMYNVKERIRLYFGEEYGLNIESQEGKYTQITVIIPKRVRL